MYILYNYLILGNKIFSSLFSVALIYNFLYLIVVIIKILMCYNAKMIKDRHKKIFFTILFFSLSLTLVFILTKAFEVFAAGLQARSLFLVDENKVAENINIKTEAELPADYLEISGLQRDGEANQKISLLEFNDQQQKYNIYFETLNSLLDKDKDKKPEGGSDAPAYILDNLGESGGFKGEASWVIINNSNTLKFLYVGVENIVNLENSCNDQEKAVQPDCDQPGKEGDLGKIINLKVALDGADRVESVLSKDQEAKISSDWAALPRVVVKPKEKRTVTIHWEVDENFYDNSVQSDSVQFEISFSLIKDNKGDKDKDIVSDVANFDEATNHLVDTDNDGLSDYEEINIYGTDYNNPDTDGDGYFDGLEIKNNYSPLLSGGKKNK